MDTTTSNPPVAISTEPPAQPASDFRLLRNEGIRWIQQLAAATWTDHNTHDPGITILDVLCYAITDLSYRLDFDMKDVLATPDDKGYNSLYSPATVLTTNPVTLLDFTKILLDVEGIQNAWIEKHTAPDVSVYFFPDEKRLRLSNPDATGEAVVLKGLYNTYLNLNPDSSPSSAAARLHNMRNLCEDYRQVMALAPQYIALSGSIEISQTEDINKTAAGILARITRFLTPQVQFYTLAKMLEKGKSTDEIFNGPALLHGFIDDDELSNVSIKAELHTSDVIREMMDEPGVLRVSNVSVYLNTPGMTSPSRQNWHLQLNHSQIPTLDMNETNGHWLTDKLVFKKNGVMLTTDRSKIKEWYIKAMTAQNHPELPLRDRDMVPEGGTYYPLGDYYSIQHHLPQLYGLGNSGLPPSVAPARKAAAKQLKAYLLFFEQILANYCAQTAHLKDLFSFTNTYSSTYFYQSLKDIVPGADDIFVVDSEDKLAENIESADAALERQNRLLNHLVARFGESLSAYSLHEKSYEYGKDKAGSTITTNTTAKAAALNKLVEDKRQFLASYPQISNDRAKAHNYTLPGWNTGNISGLEKRIAAKMGISNLTRRLLADGEEGFYLLEHLLLRPAQADHNAVIPYTTFYPIERFEDSGEGQTICISPGHGLLNGEEITISQSQRHDGVHRITWLSADRFRVDAPFGDTEENKKNSATKNQPADTNLNFKPPQWMRFTTTPHDAVLEYSKFISQFSRDPANADATICTAPAHGLASGASIQVEGTNGYDGLYNNIDVRSEDTFQITHPYSSDETGRFSVQPLQKDFYSLQLTFMFPAGAGRFGNQPFRIFAENTVREETPVHLTVYLRWLSASALLQFSHFFKRYLEEKTGGTGLVLQNLTSEAVATARLKEDQTACRACRNSLIEMLPLGISAYPLADIPIHIPEKAAELVIQYNEPATIHLLYSQSDVVYKIWDEQDNLINEKEEDAQNRGTDGPLLLTTKRLTRDKYLLSIEAINPVTNLSVRLFQTVAVRIGINTQLAVMAESVKIDYNTSPVVTVKAAQSGTLYQLMDAAGKKAMGDPVENLEGGDVQLTTRNALLEDTIFTVKATNSHTKKSALLDTRPEIKVYPNTALDKTLNKPAVADYNGNLTITVQNTQESASYAVRWEDIDDDMANKAILQNTIVGEWMNGNNGSIQFKIEKLTEDLTVSIVARKNNSLLEKVLPGTLSLPVKPDKDKVLSIEEGTPITAGEMATIRVDNTQPGILYQLRKVNKDDSFTNIGNPVFHHRNHGIGRARMETDFAIGRFENTFVSLPAGTVEQTTTFNVLATKATTKQTADLGNIKVTVKK